MDGNLANAGAAEGATMEGGDRRGESSQMKDFIDFFLFDQFYKKQHYYQIHL